MKFVIHVSRFAKFVYGYNFYCLVCCMQRVEFLAISQLHLSGSGITLLDTPIDFVMCRDVCIAHVLLVFGLLAGIVYGVCFAVTSVIRPGGTKCYTSCHAQHGAAAVILYVALLAIIIVSIITNHCSDCGVQGWLHCHPVCSTWGGSTRPSYCRGQTPCLLPGTGLQGTMPINSQTMW